MSTLPNRMEEWNLATVSNVFYIYVKRFFWSNIWLLSVSESYNSVSILLKVRKRTIKVHSDAASAEHVYVSSDIGEAGSDTSPSPRTDTRQAAEQYSCWANRACQSTDNTRHISQGVMLVKLPFPAPQRQLIALRLLLKSSIFEWTIYYFSVSFQLLLCDYDIAIYGTFYHS